MSKTRKLLALIMALCLVLSLSPAVFAADARQEAAMERWSEYGVLDGVDAEVGETITRGEAAIIFANLFGLKALGDLSAFSDIPEGAAYYEAMQKCVAAGIFIGNGNGTMTPERNLTREQFFTVFARAVGMKEAAQANVEFEDQDEIASWAEGSVNALANRGYVRGMGDGTVAPKNDMTFGHLVYLLDQTIGGYANEPGAEIEGTGDGRMTVVAAPDVTVTGEVGDLVVAEGAEDGGVKLQDATVDAMLLNTGADVVLDGETTVESIEVSENADGATLSIAEDAAVGSVDNAAEDVQISGDGKLDEVKSGEAIDVSTANTAVTTEKAEEIEGGAKTITETYTTDEEGQKGDVTTVTRTETEDEEGNTAKSTETAVQKADGTSTKTTETEETAADGSSVKTTVTEETDAEGVTTTTTETTTTDAEGNTETTTETVKTDADGNEITDEPEPTPAPADDGDDEPYTPPTPATVAVTGVEIEEDENVHLRVYSNSQTNESEEILALILNTKNADQTYQLTATVSPSNATNKSVTWSSDSEDITVSSTGLLTVKQGVKGSATITVTTADGGKTATLFVDAGDKFHISFMEGDEEKWYADTSGWVFDDPTADKWKEFYNMTPPEGMAFLGWIVHEKPQEGDVLYTPGMSITLEEDMTFYPQWAKFFTVVFQSDSNGGTVYDTQSVAEGMLATQPEAPTKEGMTFKSWAYNDGDKNVLIDFATTLITADLTVFPTWQLNSYSVVYAYDGTAPEGAPALPETRTSEYGTTVTIAAAPTLDDWTFSGWVSTDVTIGTDGTFTMPAKDVTLKGSWTEAEPDTFTVTWKSQDGTSTLETDTGVVSGTAASFDAADPTKDEDAEFTYTFAGWATSANAESGTLEANLPAVTADVTYYAAFSKTAKTFTVTWKSQDGTSTLETDTEVAYNAAASYDGAAPTKAEDAQYTYTFAGWATSANAESGTAVGSLPAVTADATYYAAFSKTAKTFTVTWKSQDGTSTLETDTEVAYNAAASYDGAAPTKAEDAQYTYTFAGWATSANAESGTVVGSLPAVTADATYYAAFSKTAKTFTVTWKNGDTVLETDENVEYGATPSFNGTDPTKDATADGTYAFDGWSTTDGGDKLESLPTVSETVTYYAHFTKTAGTYVAKIGTAGYSTLADAITAAQNDDTITLLADITLSVDYTEIHKAITLDLATFAISGGALDIYSDVTITGTTGSISGKRHAIYVNESTLTVSGGTVNAGKDESRASNQEGYAIVASGTNPSVTITGGTINNTVGAGAIIVSSGTLTISGGTITSSKDDTSAIDINGTTTATISAGTITGHDWGVAVFDTAQLTITGGTINTANDEGYGITTNGNAGQAATINIQGGTITGAELGIYQPSGTFTISGGTIIGGTGIYVKSGKLSITGATVTGNLNPADYSYWGNGAHPTGDAIAVDACEYPNGAPTVTIGSGNTISATKKQVGYYVYDTNKDCNTVDAAITSVDNTLTIGAYKSVWNGTDAFTSITSTAWVAYDEVYKPADFS